MTVTEVLEQARTLNRQERKELVKLLIDTLDIPLQAEATKQTQHWGKALNRSLDEIGPIDLVYPEIADPVEWVKHLRAEQRRRRLGVWGDKP